MKCCYGNYVSGQNKCIFEVFRGYLIFSRLRMSQESVNPQLVKSNINLLTKVVKKPNFVTEKQLSRPPFKFLHELLTLIIKNTGYLRGLYTEDEFQFEQINTKEAKIAFLDKLIDAVGFINSKEVDVKSSKIVAGVEVEKTNRLLNELAKAVSDKKPFLEAVDKVRKGLKPPAGPAAPSKAGTSTQATKKAVAGTPAKATTTKPAAAAVASKAKPPAKTQPGKATKPEPNKANSKVISSKTTKAATAATVPKKAVAKEKLEPEQSLSESLESDRSLEPQTPKTSEPASMESSTIKSQEDLRNDRSAENSLEPITNGIRKLSENLPSIPTISGNQYNRESNQGESNFISNLIVEPQNNNDNLPSGNENNLDNNLDQLVANLGLDDDEEDEDDQVMIQPNIMEPNFVAPDDSGIDSKSNSVSTNQSEPPEFQQMDPLPEVPQEPEIASLNPTIRDPTPSLKFESQEESQAESRVASSSTTTSTSSRQSQAKQQSEPTVNDRKKSATIRGRRASKSSVPPQALPISGTSAKDQALNYRGQHFPSSAAPLTHTSTTNGTPVQRSPPVMQQPQQDQYDQDEQSLKVRTRAPPTARSARPSSSRPAPPRVMTASRSRLTRLMENRASEQVPNGTTPVTPDVWPPPEGLNLELNLDEGEDADDYVMSSKKLQDSLLKMEPNDNDTQDNQSSEQFGSDKGRLVQQLIATKSELEGSVGPKAASITRQEDDVNTSADTKQLRTNVHELCQSIGGLSKALNYLHEDVDPMLSELQKWREEYRTNLAEIERIKATTQKELEPLRKELEVVELEVAQYAERLLNAKAGVHRNAISIGKLIESV